MLLEGKPVSLTRVPRSSTSFVILVMMLTGVGGLFGPAQAEARHATSSPSALVSQVRVVGRTPLSTSTLTLNFDQPTSRAQADRAAARLGNQLAIQARSTAYLSCGNDLSNSDSNGTLTLQYNCSTKTRTVPWGYNLSAAVRKIVVGTVAEDGLRWWKNGSSMPKNAGHVVAAGYHFHGTMKPVANGNTLDYQDVFKFRHNVGSGGSAVLTFAGTVHLHQNEG